jgi:hypothetical protein
MAARGSTSARGYGWRHQQVKKRVGLLVASGAAFCTRCGEPIDPLDPWDLDHSDDRSRWVGPAHRSCNRSAGAAKGNASRGRRVSVDLGGSSREW